MHFFLWLFQPIQFRNHSFTAGRTPWTSDQRDKMPLPKHRTTQTQNKRMHTPNIHALSGIQRKIPASERAKKVHSSDRAATVTSYGLHYTDHISNQDAGK
jgi:hypothetical protein